MNHLAPCVYKECEKSSVCNRYTEDRFDNHFRFDNICMGDNYKYFSEKKIELEESSETQQDEESIDSRIENEGND